MADELGSVSVAVRADLGPLGPDLDRGRQLVQKFEAQTVASSKNATGALASIRLAGEKAAQSAALLTGPLGGAASRISILSRVTSGWNLAVLAGGVAVGGLALGLKAAITEAEKFEQIQRRTEAVLKATGFAAGLTAKDIRGLADELDNTTLADPADIEQASQMLLTFRSVAGDTFKEAIKLSVDLSEVGFGSVSSSAVQMGKALEDPVQGMAALRRVGVSFTETQKDQIKNFQETGQLLEAQKVILKAVADQVGGAASGSTGGLTGAIDDLGDAYDRFLRKLGKKGPLESWLTWLAQAGAAVINTTSKMTVATDQEHLSALEDHLANLKSRTGDSTQVDPTMQAVITGLETEIGLLREKLSLDKQSEDQQNANAKAASKEAQATADKERAFEQEKSLASARLSAVQSAADDELTITQARITAEQAANEAAYNTGAKSLEEYQARRRQLTEAGVDAEIAALQKKRTAAAGAATDGPEADIAKGQELASLDAQIAAKKQERIAATYELTAATNAEVRSIRDEAEVGATLAALYDGTAASLRKMATEEEVLNGLKRAGLSLSSEAGRALADEIRQNQDAANALQDRIASDKQSQGVRQDISQFQAEDKASTMPHAQAAAFLKEQELLTQQMSTGAPLTEAQATALHNLATAYGDAKAASDAFRQTQAAEQQFAQQTTDAISSLVEGLVTGTESAKTLLIKAAGEIVKAMIKMVAQVALAQSQASSGGGGGFNWGALVGKLVGSLFGAAAGSFAGGGGYGLTGGGGLAGPGVANGSIRAGGIGGGSSFPVAHAGWKVGSPSGSMRTVPAEAFINAPHYHRGVRNLGMSALGLRPDERAAILQTGEDVIPRGGSRGGGGTVNNWYVTTNDANSFIPAQRQIQRKSRLMVGI